MGSFNVSFGISDGNGGATCQVTAQVDTGAVHTVLPASLLHRVGVKPRAQPERFTLGDGRVVEWRTGQACIQIEDRDAISPVIFAETEETYLLGATSLQVLNLIPDTSNERLIPAPVLTI